MKNKIIYESCKQIIDFQFQPIAQMLFNDPSEVAGELLGRYSEPHRFYHTVEHIENLLKKINKLTNITKQEKSILQMVAYFHDAVYDPRVDDNEYKSSVFFEQQVKASKLRRNSQVMKRISEIIFKTCYKQEYEDDKLFQVFKNLDFNRPLFESNVVDLLENEKKIQKEYQVYDYPSYKHKRIEFLLSVMKEAHSSLILTSGLDHLMTYIKNYRMNVGVYAGSFDPFHSGHMNILEQAEKHFDKVIILVATDPGKGSLNIESRVKKVKEVLPFHEVDSWNGTLPDYITYLEGRDQNATLIRGLRTGYDLDYEINLKRFLADSGKEINITYFVGDGFVQHVSSSAIRSISNLDPGFYQRYKPLKYSYHTKYQ